MVTVENLKRTPLYQQHLALNARLVPFGGWEMPVQYDGILAEYEQTRKQASLFDTCHMGEFIIEGDLKKSRLDRIVTMALEDLPVNSCRYGLLLNEHAGAIDDLIVFRLHQERWLVVVNGATIEKDAKQFVSHLDPSYSTFKNASEEMGKIDLQGPGSRDVLAALVPNAGKLGYYTFDFFDLLGENVLISRTGYTGELGYEIFYPWAKISKLWDRLLENKAVKPAGLGARDILRLEMGYSLYGHELDETIHPLEAGLAKFVDLKKDFVGKEKLLQKQGSIARKIVGIVSESRRSPRAQQKIYHHQTGEEIGVITSGSFSPALEKGIGLAFVRLEDAELKNRIFFGDEKTKTEAVVTGRMFYKNGSLKD